ncbi:MAG: hypothetical protein ACREPL_01045, partial [Rhodanobacteraceae bacterium]
MEKLVIPEPSPAVSARNPESSFPAQWSKSWINSPHPRLALRAIGSADVRSGILPPQSGSARDGTG